MSWAAKTPIRVHSRASSSAKYAGTDRRDSSASCQEARMTIGTRSAIRASITSAMPSVANVKLTPHCGIQS
jgi:hypothetical protein